jgi:predicted nucleic acid-binding protein
MSASWHAKSDSPWMRCFWLQLLPVSVIERGIYARTLAQARTLIGRRDPDDVDILALTLHFRIPLWSNDSDFEDTGVEWYTTARLLQKLGISGSK